MQHVCQRFRVHQAVFDGDIEQSAERKSVSAGGIGIQRLRQFLVQGDANFSNILPHCGNRWPLRRLIRRQSTADRIDTESKQTIELWIKTFQSEHTIMQKIPIECFEMSDVKNDAMALGNGAIVKRIGIHDGKKLVGFLTGGRYFLNY